MEGAKSDREVIFPSDLVPTRNNRFEIKHRESTRKFPYGARGGGNGSIGALDRMGFGKFGKLGVRGSRVGIWVDWNGIGGISQREGPQFELWPKSGFRARVIERFGRIS